MIRSHQRGGAVPIDTPEQIARAIQKAIAQRGTMPHRYMAQVVPAVELKLVTEIQKAIPDR